MSGFTNKPTIALVPNSSKAIGGVWTAVLSGPTTTALIVRHQDIAVVDVRHHVNETWRVTLYMRGVTTPFNIDGDLKATQALVDALQLPLHLSYTVEEKL